jgi:hypothetical protein
MPERASERPSALMGRVACTLVGRFAGALKVSLWPPP